MSLSKILLTAKTLITTSLPTQIASVALVVGAGTAGVIVHQNNTSEQSRQAETTQTQTQNQTKASGQAKDGSADNSVDNKTDVQDSVAPKSSESKPNSPNPAGQNPRTTTDTKPKTQAPGAPANTGDTTPPTVSIISPQSGASFKNEDITGYSTKIVANASDNVGVTKYEFYKNGKLMTNHLGMNSPSIDWIYAYEHILSTTTFSFVVKAYDAAGNVGVSPQVTYTLTRDPSPPTVSVTSPINGSTVSGVININVTATNDDNSIQSVSFWVSAGGQIITGYTDSTAPYSYSFDTTGINNGPLTINVSARNNYGSMSFTDIYLTVAN